MRAHPSSFAKAFSIVEIMFAIMILGIGFIMVAAIFPVGIQQGRDAVDETTGLAISRQAANRAASVLRLIADDPNTATRDTNLAAIQMGCNGQYLWADPNNNAQRTMGTTAIGAGNYGGGVVYYRQQMGANWQYQGEKNYISHVFFKLGTTPPTWPLDVLALAFRDGRAPADQGNVLGAPYYYNSGFEICTDGKPNVYSDLYIRNSMGWTEQQVRDFLGTRGTVVTAGGTVYSMSNEPPTLQFGAPPAGATAWQPAFFFSSDVPVIGSFKLTTSLP